MIQLFFLFESTCLWFDQEENDPTQICVWIDFFLIRQRGKWPKLNLCLNQIVYDLTKMKIIWLEFVVESTWFWFDQEENDPNQNCVWIDLFLIWPRGKWSNPIFKKSTWFWLDQEENHLTQSCDWIALFLFRPRGKWSNLIESIFESYLEVNDDTQSVRGCISGEYVSFVSDDIFLHGWQAGTKSVSVCRIVGVCRSV